MLGLVECCLGLNEALSHGVAIRGRINKAERARYADISIVTTSSFCCQERLAEEVKSDEAAHLTVYRLGFWE